MISANLYPRYKELRKQRQGLPASQAFLWARAEVVRRCRNQLLGSDDPRHPDKVDEARSYMMAFFTYNGYDCKVGIEPDDMRTDDDILGFTISRNINPYREPGWGHDGMDRGLYAVDDDTLVTFNETREEVIKYAPKGMSKQLAYEWATQSMQNRLDHYTKCVDGDVCSFVVSVECDELSIMECLGGVDIDLTDSASDKYVEEVVDELYDQFVYEFDKQKIVA